MRLIFLLIFATFMCLILNKEVIAGKKKKKSKKSKISPSNNTQLIDKNTLKCLVCQNLISEFESAIWRTDPNKKIDNPVSYRDKSDGIVKRKVVPYARSQIHLLELTENICKQFEDYAQAKTKKSGEPTIIRITTPDGNMNPEFGTVDIVPDDNLNTRLKFHCETIVEEMDEHFLELLADDSNTPTLEQKICVEEGAYCPSLKDEL